MNRKSTALAFLLTLMLSAVPLVYTVAASGPILILPDDELATFAYEWGPGGPASVTVTDTGGAGVTFTFTGLDLSSGTGVGDNFPANSAARGAYKDYGYGFAGYYDFTGYGEYRAGFTNPELTDITVCLFINTGWTDDWSGGNRKGDDSFGASKARDTYWQSAWTTIPAGTTVVLVLDFASATCHNAGDDPVVEWRHPDDTSGVPVRRLDEVSNIGFQVRGTGDVTLVVNEYPEQVIPEVPVGTFVIATVMAIAIIGFVGFRHFRPKLPRL